MSENNNLTECKLNPSIYIQKIRFNDNAELELTNNSIVVFTGANNTGKSQVLKDIENSLDSKYKAKTIVINSLECRHVGDITCESFLESHFCKTENGMFHIKGTGYSIESLIALWKNVKLPREVLSGFVNRLDTYNRLTASNALSREFSSNNDPIYKVYKSEKLLQIISDYFHLAFGVDLITNRNDLKMLPLHVGKAPDKDAYTIRNQDEYYEQIEAFPKLEEQGDGMRSFASILLDTFTSDYSITLVDEPEAFLHPPQSRVLGKMLTKNNPQNRQLFISTHSEDFLQGLLDADSANVTVVRMNRNNNTNNISILTNEDTKKLWINPLLRYSNILSGLFHEKVVVCESDYDCLFYQAIINAIYEESGDIAPDILFTHCGGKTRMKDIVCALKAIDVPVVAICDFDILNKKDIFKPLVEAFGESWNNIESEMKCIYDNMNAKGSHGVNAWENIKKIGKSGFDGDAPAAYEKVEVFCQSIGLFIVPVGEMECFVKIVNKEKKEWVYHILENFDLTSDSKLNSVRDFVKVVVNF